MARPLLGRRRAEPIQARKSLPRSLTASATVIDLGDRNEAKRLKQVKQSWQGEAWAYRRNLGEARYATAYLGNSSMRMRLFPATHIDGEENPVDVGSEQAALPPDLVEAARDLMDRLGNGGPLALANMLKRLTENFEVAGECYLCGIPDPITQIEEWSIRSISEVDISESGRIMLREAPGGGGKNNGTELGPDSYVVRLWWPDPEWSQLADSPFRAILDVCEELLLLGREVRATARSRLANNGILFLPDTLSIIRNNNGETDDDLDSDPFFQELIDTATASLQNEGSASAVVPIVIRGPSEAGAAIKHILIERPNHTNGTSERQELISRMATGLDLPAEVLTGKIDLNHWTAWQVDDDTFRHHIEPIVIVEVDALTAGYLWPMLEAYNKWPSELIRQVLVWYDPTELVTHPDRSQDAFQAWDRMAISDKALRTYLGFPETDRPDDQELLLRMVTHLRSLDPSIQAQILQRLDPSLQPPPTDAAAPPATAGPAPAEPQPVLPGPPPGANSEASAANIDEARLALLASAIVERIAPAMTAAATHEQEPAKRATAEDRKLSQQLVRIDQDLRAKLRVAAASALKRSLEKAGAKVVSKARTPSAASMKPLLKDVPLSRVPSVVPNAMLAALGLHERQLLDTEFAELEKQFDRWVGEAQEQAARAVAKLVGKQPATVVADLSDKNKANRDKAWTFLQKQLDDQAASLFSQMDDQDAEDLDAGAGVTAGLVRASIGIAGGFLNNSSSSGLDDNGKPVDVSETMGQIGNGYTVSSYVEENGGEREAYQWVHGPAGRPFEPHLDLDGVTFQNFDDDALANDEDFPAYDYYACGDHDGCSCDFMPIWISASASEEDSSAA